MNHNSEFIRGQILQQARNLFELNDAWYRCPEAHEPPLKMASIKSRIELARLLGNLLPDYRQAIELNIEDGVLSVHEEALLSLIVFLVDGYVPKIGC